MKRYLRLYLHFLRFSFSRALEFRLDFTFRIVMDTMFYAVHLAFFTILYQHTASLGGWSLDQVYVFVCAYFLLDAVHMTVFSNNLWWFPIFVNRGDLDYHLVRPVSTLFFMSLRDFAANSFVNLLIAGGLAIWSLARFPEPLGAERIVVYFGLLGVGCFLFFVMHMLFLLPVIWIQSGRGLDELFYHLERFAERPHQIYRGWMRVLLVSVLPFALLVSVPAHALFDGLTWGTLGHMVGVAAAAFGLLLWLWDRALAAYSSASS